jgi:hypothetical protein
VALEDNALAQIMLEVIVVMRFLGDVPCNTQLGL